ncbi:MAG TPA: flagellar basal body P-ring formation chaperone FlgA [Fibrobacteraceae bacterium]|nr:flagellar basal body P-ring formation chaperone FlgA [Fibrobacteraceae bacterium]
MSFAWAARATVELRPVSEISPGRIHLSDVATLHGDAGLVQRLSALEIGRLELPGRETRLSVNTLKTFYIRSVCPPESLEILGKGSLVVRSRASYLQRDSLERLLLETVGPRMQGIMGRDWELETSRLPEKVPVPDNHYQWTMELPANFNARGQEMAVLRISIDGVPRMRYSLPFTVRRWTDVVRTISQIQRGQTIQKNQVAIQRLETTHLSRPYVSRLEDALGRKALRTISPDQNLVEPWLEKPYQIHEGDQVRMSAQIGEAQVSTLAIAKENGYTGQRIDVINANTGKVIQAQINGPGEVQVLN